MLGPKNRICQVCARKESKYKCPKCNVSYCTVDCYRSHGTGCTEKFFKKHVKDEMSLRKHENKNLLSKQRLETMKMLQRNRSQFDDDCDEGSYEEEEEEDLVERLEKLLGVEIDQDQHMSQLDNLLDEVPADRLENILTPKELEQFRKEISSGNIYQIQAWQPWWCQDVNVYTKYRRSNFAPIISVAGADDCVSIQNILTKPKYPCSCPCVFRFKPVPTQACNPLPSLSELTTTAPSPEVVYHVCDVVSAYIEVMRKFNGEMLTNIDVAEQAAEYLIQRSRILNEPSFRPVALKQCFDLESSGIQIDTTCVLKGSGKNPLELSKVLESSKIRQAKSELYKDFLRFAQSPNPFAVDALLDCWFLFHHIVDKNKKNTKAVKRKKNFCKTAIRIERKLWFLTLWTNENYNNSFQKISYEALQLQ